MRNEQFASKGKFPRRSRWSLLGMTAKFYFSPSLLHCLKIPPEIKVKSHTAW